MSKADKVIELGKEKYNADFLRSVTEEKAVRTLLGKNHSQVRNAWKQANGKTERNYSKNKTEEKKKWWVDIRKRQTVHFLKSKDTMFNHDVYYE